MFPHRRMHAWKEIFAVFLRLGCTSFGGPIAHLGYFQRELIDRRAWCSKETYAEIIALAQSIPGPASSQTGFALGLLRGGLAGGLAAFFGFTLPSALLMVAFAFGHNFFSTPVALRALHGLELVAVAIVAQAVVSMQRSLAPNMPRILIAVAAAATTLFLPTRFATLVAIAIGLVAGLLFCPMPDASPLNAPPSPVSRSTGLVAGALFAFLLILSELPARSQPATLLPLAAAFYRSGALVFGGGHVVLPLLETAVVAPGWISQPTFLAGYGAAQAVPGPLFTFSAYIGASVGISAHRSGIYSVAAVIAIFLPGLLLMLAILPFWNTLRLQPAFRSALRGINASVVGVLLAALIRPLATTALHSLPDILSALAGLALLLFTKVPTWAIVLGGALLCAFLPGI